MRATIGFLCALLACSHGTNYQDNYERTQGVQSLMSQLRLNLPEILDRVEKSLSLEDQLEFKSVFQTPYIGLGDCGHCTDIISLLKAIIRLGHDYEKLKPVAMIICKSYAEGVGWDADGFCPGTLDNFGPHVVYILRKSPYTASEVCLKLNMCSPDEVDGGQEFLEKNLPRETYPETPKREARKAPLKIVQLTDVHVELDYLEGSPTKCPYPVCCRSASVSETSEGKAGKFGDYKCNIPSDTVELFLDFMTALEPDIVVYTGDSPPHTLWLETQEGQLKVSAWVADAIHKHFPGIPVFPSLGNHETYPTNMYYTDRLEIQELNEEYAKMWQDAAGFGSEQLETINMGAFYSKLVKPGLRVVSYNSIYGATDNFYNLLNEDREDYHAMKTFMKETLLAARDNNEKVLLLGHHSLGSSETMLHHERFMVNLIAEFGDVICLHLMGHSHTDFFKLVNIEISDPSSNEVHSVQFVTPSVTTKMDINPSARVFYLDPDTLVPLDQETFYLDLNKYMEGDSKDAKIETSYKFTEEYGVDDLTPASLKKLVDRCMENDDELLNKYRYNFLTKQRQPEECNATCKKRILCRIRHSTQQGNKLCQQA
ncbi:hypothetical protein CAPTEDRAFT_206548 [Capitella teleta]|uniref:Sphingomyelin phosphodiesterase n=1 Tax=Capitella teleta TaxID=283909 RepID=R7T5I3_CAPTE|nr:hypothetical protein CAPTEDRAFT_206548 [Capitella teleta]|eukprot:ELT88291.1 hypothetical protein CAPTEDRAFT_206548 [Capitella teleta]